MVSILNLVSSNSELVSNQIHPSTINLCLLTSFLCILPFYHPNHDSFSLPTIADEASCQRPSESLTILHLLDLTTPAFYSLIPLLQHLWCNALSGFSFKCDILRHFDLAISMGYYAETPSSNMFGIR